jgi:hypothetical protein
MTAMAMETTFPLSPAQQGMLFQSLLAPRSGVYVQQLLWILREDLDLAAFEESWRRAVARHPALRTRFEWEGVSEPLQHVRPDGELAIRVHDLRSLAGEEKESVFERFRRDEAGRGIDMSRLPNVQLTVFRVHDGETWVLWTNHHAILDGHSRNQITREVLATYDALRRGAAVEVQGGGSFAEYLDWVRTRPLEKDEAFWRTLFEGWAGPTSIPVLGAPPKDPPTGPDGEEVEVSVPEGSTRALIDLARQRGESC